MIIIVSDYADDIWWEIWAKERKLISQIGFWLDYNLCDRINYNQWEHEKIIKQHGYL